MWRAHARVRPLQDAFARLQCSAKPPSSSVRRFSQQESLPLPPVRVVGPVLWSIAAVGTIYFTCAAYEVRRDLKDVPKKWRSLATESAIANRKQGPERLQRGGLAGILGTDGANPIAGFLNRHGEVGWVFASLVGINLCTLVPSTASPIVESALLRNLAHFPAEPNFRYHQLLTSAFLHSGAVHMGLNMMVFYNFGPDLAHTRAFQSGSGSAFLAYCLSAGIISSLGSHVSTLFWPNKTHRLRFGLGFSGVATALVATTCVVFPHAKLSVFPIPMQFEARNFLEFLKGFEALGVLGLVGRVLPFMGNIGFAAHLSGLLFGEAYGRWSRDGEVWRFWRVQAYRTMKQFGVV